MGTDYRYAPREKERDNYVDINHDFFPEKLSLAHYQPFYKKKFVHSINVVPSTLCC